MTVVRRPRVFAGNLELPVQGRSEGGGTCRGLTQSRLGLHHSEQSLISPHLCSNFVRL